MPDGIPSESVGRRDRGLAFTLWPFLVLVLYALSVGPVAKWCRPTRELRLLYAPLAFAYDHFPPARAFYDWYAKLWGVKL